jgi:hypothetical protein
LVIGNIVWPITTTTTTTTTYASVTEKETSMPRTPDLRPIALAIALGLSLLADPLAAADAASRRADLVEKLTVIIDRSEGDYLILEPEVATGELMEVEMDGLGPQGTLVVMYETYPESEAPERALARAGIALPAGGLVGPWEPATFAQFRIPAADPAAVAAFADELFLKLGKLPDDYDLFVSAERLR